MRHHQPLLSYGASAPAFAGTPSFDLPLTNTLVPTTALGSATATYSCTGSFGSVGDWEGLVKRTVAGEARFTGARRVENLVAGHSQDFTNAGWTKNNGGTSSATPTVTANFATDPIGGSTASRLQTNMGSDPSAGYSRAVQSVAMSGIRTYKGSFWLKANTGTPTITIRVWMAGLNVGTNITLDSTWRRYVTSPLTTTSAIVSVGIDVGSFGTVHGSSGNSTTADFLVWGAMLEDVSGQSNQNPGDYVSRGVLAAPYHGAAVDAVKYFTTKNGNTVAGSIVTNAVGAAINTANGGATLTTDSTGPFGLLMEIAQNNTGNITTETGFNGWTQVGSTVTEFTATAPSGETAASALVEDGANSQHGISHNGSVSSSTAIIQSVFVKAAGRTQVYMGVDAGSGNTVYIGFNLSGAGSIAIAQAGAGTAVGNGAGIIAYPNGWYRIYQGMTFVSTVSGASFTIYAMSGGTVTYTGNSSTALYVWGSQLDGQGGFDSMPRSYSQGTRGTDVLTYSFATNASATVGTAYAEVKSEWTSALATYPVVAFATSPNFPLYAISGDAATTIRTNDGTTSVQKTGLSSMNTAMRKVASSWTGSVLAVTGSGATAATGTFDGNMGSTGIGIGQPTTSTGVVWNGNIRNLKLYTTAATAAELAGMTA